MAAPKKTTKSNAARSFTKPYAWLLTVGGGIGFFASFILTLDKIEKLKNPAFQPNCDINPVISCGDVMSSWQGSVFGFPNSMVGIAMFAALGTIGVALLAGAQFKRWFWRAMLAGITLGLVFALWMLQQSIYSINALCPYCLVVDVVTIVTFWYTVLHLAEMKALTVPARLARPARFVRKHHLDVLVVVFILLVAIILNHFWYYYGSRLGF